jgi:hypothetical protein
MITVFVILQSPSEESEQINLFNIVNNEPDPGIIYSLLASYVSLQFPQSP